LVASLTDSLAPLAEDSFRSFFLDAVHSLSHLGISSKQQAKLISLLLTSLSSPRRAVVENHSGHTSWYTSPRRLIDSSARQKTFLQRLLPHNDSRADD
jgi:hypothetical protein